MDLSYGESHERFREEVRAFLRAWPLTGAEAKLPAAEQASLFRGRAIEAGYVYRDIPAEYGGGGLGNLGSVESVPIRYHDHPHSVTLTLPPLSAVFLKWEGEEPALPGLAERNSD